MRRYIWTFPFVIKDTCVLRGGETPLQIHPSLQIPLCPRDLLSQLEDRPLREPRNSQLARLQWALGVELGGGLRSSDRVRID